MELRSFRNSDPPAVVALWNRLPKLPLRAQPLSLARLELHVLTKPRFDPRGLILAFEGREPLGMIHATMPSAPAADGTREGLLLQLSVPHQPEEKQIAARLIAAAEEYWRQAGAARAVTRTAALEPMYFGLYGGSDHPGVLADDPAAGHLRMAEWLETGRVHLVQRELADFRPVFDMVQRKLRMAWNVVPRPDPPPRDEAEAFALVHSDHTRFELADKQGRPGPGSCLTWDMEPLASLEAGRMAGLIRVETDPARRKSGLATLLVGEALVYAKNLQITSAHAQFDAADQPSARLFQKLGFARIGEGLVLRKAIADAG